MPFAYREAAAHQVLGFRPEVDRLELDAVAHAAIPVGSRVTGSALRGAPGSMPHGGVGGDEVGNSRPTSVLGVNPAAVLTSSTPALVPRSRSGAWTSLIELGVRVLHCGRRSRSGARATRFHVEPSPRNRQAALEVETRSSARSERGTRWFPLAPRGGLELVRNDASPVAWGGSAVGHRVALAAVERGALRGLGSTCPGMGDLQTRCSLLVWWFHVEPGTRGSRKASAGPGEAASPRPIELPGEAAPGGESPSR